MINPTNTLMLFAISRAASLIIPHDFKLIFHCFFTIVDTFFNNVFIAIKFIPIDLTISNILKDHNLEQTDAKTVNLNNPQVTAQPLLKTACRIVSTLLGVKKSDIQENSDLNEDVFSSCHRIGLVVVDSSKQKPAIERDFLYILVT
jgi:hypothetical protein